MAYSFLTAIKALIIDMDGVLWRGSEPIGDLRSTYNKIEHAGWKVVFATNNSTRTIEQYTELLKSYGVSIKAWQIVNSATAVVEYLKKRFPEGGPVYIIGEQGIVEACTQHGFYPDEKEAIAVIAGIDRSLTYDKLRHATLLIRAGVPFIGTNPDRTFPTPQGLVPGAGAILAALTAASDVSPVIVGKPEPTMYKIAIERLQIAAGEALVIGDRPETDIAGAQVLGCRTAIVLSGVTDIEQANAWRPKPDIISADLTSLVSLLSCVKY